MARPNIVLIMTDQQRADFFRSEGFALDTMPFVDAWSAQGARFRRAYTPMPVCAPARCSLFAGRYPKATRVRENGGIRNFFGPDDLARILRGLGYSVNLCGKNHSHLRREDFDFHSPYGHNGGGRPERLTDEFRAMDAWLKDLRHRVSLEPAPFPAECQPPARVVSDAIECVDLQADRPFFLWLSFAEPHNPYQVSEPYYSLFPEASIPERAAGPEAIAGKGAKWRWERALLESKNPGYDRHWRRYRANYLGMIRLIDDQLRRFAAHLERRGLTGNTLVVYVSDHGDYAADYGLLRKGVALPECLVRVPFWIAGPGVRPDPIPREDFVSLVDVMPTLAEALGVEPPYGVQGRSLWPMIAGGEYPREEFRSAYAELGFGGVYYGEEERPKLHFTYEEPYFDELNSVTQSGNLKMVRMGKWKLTFDMLGRGQLFDIESDPAELRDRWAEPALGAVREELLAELLRWAIRTEDDLPGGSYTPKRADRNWHSRLRGAE